MHVPYCKILNLSHQGFFYYFSSNLWTQKFFSLLKISPISIGFKGSVAYHVCALRPVCSWEKSFCPNVSAISKKIQSLIRPSPQIYEQVSGETSECMWQVNFARKERREGQKGLSPQGEKESRGNKNRLLKKACRQAGQGLRYLTKSLEVKCVTRLAGDLNRNYVKSDLLLFSF